MANLQDAETAEEKLSVGRRAAPRARLHVAATLQTIAKEFRVVIRNLSCTGAMIEGDQLPTLGRTVLLKRDSIEAMATVVWTEQGRCGLEFFDPIDHEEVVRQARQRPERIEVSATPYYWRAEQDEGLSVEEWQSAKASVLRSKH